MRWARTWWCISRVLQCCCPVDCPYATDDSTEFEGMCPWPGPPPPSCQSVTAALPHSLARTRPQWIMNELSTLGGDWRTTSLAFNDPYLNFQSMIWLLNKLVACWLENIFTWDLNSHVITSLVLHIWNRISHKWYRCWPPSQPISTHLTS